MDEMISLLERLRPAIERLGGGRHDGEDLYGDVALACVERCQQYDWSHPKIEGRVIHMARYLQIRRFRRERVRKHVCLPAEDCGELAYEDRPWAGMQARDCVCCQEAIDRLPDPYRRVVREHFTQGKRFIAIAREMKLPSGTIRTHSRRALQELARDPTIRELAASEERQS